MGGNIHENANLPMTSENGPITPAATQTAQLTTIKPTDLRGILQYVPRFQGQIFVIAIDGSIVADENFACGSSREHAPQAMRAIGVGAVVADSFARIFYRNAINLGIPTIEVRGVRQLFEKGDTARIDMRAGRVTNLRTGAFVSFPPLPHHLLELLEAGGLVEKVRSELARRKATAGAG